MSFAAGWRARALVAFLTFAVAVMGLPLQATQAAAISPDIVISQIYGGGGNAGATLKNDFIELFNRGTATINVSTWSVQYAAATGTTWQRTNLSGSIPPGRYYLVQEAAGTGGTASLPTPDASGSIAMSATSAKVAVVKNQTTMGAISCPSGATIADFVGFGSNANCFEDGGPTGTLSNTTAAVRGDSGCTDTDSNSSDFTVGAPNPRNSASPVKICGAITINVSIVGSGAVSSDPAGINCPTTCSASFFPGTTITLTAGAAPSGAEFSGWAGACAGGGSCVLTASANVKAVYGPAALTRIHDIQGATHYSTFAGQFVRTTGVVTAKRDNGLYIQDPEPDTDAATSEGIFVFADAATTSSVAVNDLVKVVGTVAEFAFSTAQLSTTEIRQDLVLKIGTGTIAPTIIGAAGRLPPTTVIENDASGSENTTNATFDPDEDGLDFYESLEGMLVEIDNAVAVSPTSARFGELWVVGDNGTNASPRSAHGGVVVTPTDFNPERIMVSDEIVRPATGSACGSLGASGIPCVNVGATFTAPLVGVMDYDFSTYRVVLLARPTVALNPLAREVTARQGLDQLAVATFNVENLAPSDPQSKFDGLASLIVNNLSSPDIVALEEIQDNNGTTDNGVVAADQTIGKLIAAISAAGGPSYDWRSINPVDDQDGGAPGGNIRVGYIFRTDRGLAFVDRPGATSTTPNAVVGTGTGTHLAYSPGRIDPLNAAWTSSRKPLAAEWTFNGYRFFTIANHFNSKLGDESLEGVDQPPQRSSEDQRHQQATAVNAFVEQLETADPSVDVVVLGDLNDFQFSGTVTTLEGAQLHVLANTLPISEQYSYVFEGNSQAIDHILLGNHTFTTVPYTYDIVHVNSEFTDQASDHEPQVVRLTFDRTAPSVTAPATTTTEATSTAGAPVTFTCSAIDAVTTEADLIWDFSFPSGTTFPLGTTTVECGATDAAGNRGSATFEVRVVDTTPPSIAGSRLPVANGYGWNNTPVTVTFTCSDYFFASCLGDTTLTGDGAGQSVTGTATDTSNNSASATVSGINIDQVAPTIGYAGNAGTYTVDQTIAITCSASDGLSGLATNTCANISGPASTFLGTQTYTASATDKAGNTSSATATFTVSVTADSLCAVVRSVVSNTGVANSLCQKLANAAAADARGNRNAAQDILDAFKSEASAQSGKAMTEANATLLRSLAAAF